MAAPAAARPLDLGHLLAPALRRLRDRLRLQHARVKGRGPVRKRRAVLVERVVGRAGHGGPRARRQAVPARARVRRRLRQQPVVRRISAGLQQPPERGQRALLDVARHPVLHEPVGGEEDQARTARSETLAVLPPGVGPSARVWRPPVGRRRHRRLRHRRRAHRRGQRRQDQQHDQREHRRAATSRESHSLAPSHHA